jgi:hypothetical protein
LNVRDVRPRAAVGGADRVILSSAHGESVLVRFVANERLDAGRNVKQVASWRWLD